MTGEKATADLAELLTALEQRLGERFDALQRQTEALERRVDHRMMELRSKQDEDLMLVKALSCQLRGRVERVERRGARG